MCTVAPGRVVAGVYTPLAAARLGWECANHGMKRGEEETLPPPLPPVAVACAPPQFTALGLVNTAWAFVKLGVRFDPLLPAFARQLLNTDHRAADHLKAPQRTGGARSAWFGG